MKFAPKVSFELIIWILSFFSCNFLSVKGATEHIPCNCKECKNHIQIHENHISNNIILCDMANVYIVIFFLMNLM